MNWSFGSDFMDLLVRTLLHGTVLALLTWALCSTLLRNVRPAVHCALWTVVLLKFFAPPVLPVFVSLSGWLSRFGSGFLDPVLSEQGGIKQVALGRTRLIITGDSGWLQSLGGSELWTLGVLVLYLAGLTWVLMRVFSEVVEVRRNLRGLREPSAELSSLVEALGARLGLRRMPRIRISDEKISPFVTGLVSPVLVIPERLVSSFSSETLEALILHELAHIRRGDLVLRWLQNTARVLLFFWPPVQWVSRRIERTAELACDQWAMNLSNISPKTYAQSLLSVVRQLEPLTPSHQRLSFARKGSMLEERFKMILKKHSQVSPKLNWFMLPLLSVWVAFALGGTVETEEPVAKHEKHIVLKVDGRGEPIQISASVCPEADLDQDGFLTIEELDSYAQANPDSVDLEIIQEADGDRIELRISGDHAVHETAHIEMHRLHEVQEGHEADQEIRTMIFVDDEGNVTTSVHPGHGDPGAVFFSQKLPEPDFSAVLEEHPEADLDGNGVLSPEEYHAHLEASGIKPDVFVFKQDDAAQGERKVQVIKLSPEKRLELDTDGDGSVSDDELEAFLESQAPIWVEHPGSVTEAGQQEIHVEVVTDGTDKDVLIIREKASTEKPLSPEERRKQFLSSNPEADLDGDGVITKQEAEAFAAKLQKERQKSKVKPQ